MSLNFNEIRELIAAIAQTDITELTLKSDKFHLTIRKGTIVVAGEAAGAISEAVAPTITPPSKEVSVPTIPSETPPPPPSTDKKWVEITSPMVGTFYRAPAPNEPPFVEVGDRISKGQTVCIIEAMKLMNEIEAEITGKVMEILVENGEPVEYGQKLMSIDPD